MKFSLKGYTWNLAVKLNDLPEGETYFIEEILFWFWNKVEVTFLNYFDVYAITSGYSNLEFFLSISAYFFIFISSLRSHYKIVPTNDL